MLRSEQRLDERSLCDLKVVGHVEALPWREALSKTKDSVNFLRDAELLFNKEELEGLDAELEVLEADLILHDLTLHVDQIAILPEAAARVHDLKVAGSVWVIAIAKAVLAVATLDEHQVGACVVDQLHLHVTLTQVDRARVEVVKAVREVKLDVVVVDRLA